jgi:hypothetical protein
MAKDEPQSADGLIDRQTTAQTEYGWSPDSYRSREQ